MNQQHFQGSVMPPFMPPSLPGGIPPPAFSAPALLAAAAYQHQNTSHGPHQKKEEQRNGDDQV